MSYNRVLLPFLLLGMFGGATGSSQAVEVSKATSATGQLCDNPLNQCTFVLLFEQDKNQAAGKKPVKKNGNHHIAHLSDTNLPFIAVNPIRAATPMTPFSTFKIANSVIALETGVVAGIYQTLPYNSTLYPPASWWPANWLKQSHNLRSAFKNSVVPVYRQLASEIGESQMKTYLQKFNYGNRDISSGLDDFWLDGSLKISAIEQVYFLQALKNNDFLLSPKNLNKLKDIMFVSEGDRYQLFAKTGGGSLGKNKALAWYVGFVETTHGSYYFALNISGKTFSEIKQKRIDLVMAHLKGFGVIE